MQELTNVKIRFRNFLSYGNSWTEIEFINGVATFLIGENHDTGSNNGCGKSAILNAIVFAIYNKPYDNITLPRLINNVNAIKSTLMEVEYTFKKDAVYEIKRTRGESTGVTLIKDGVDITPDSINETDILIEQIYGYSYELFVRCIVFAGNSIPFLDLPVSQQRNHIEELFNITILSEKASKLKKLIQTTEGDIRVETAVLKEKETAQKLQQKRLTDIEAKVIQWEEQTQNTINKLKKELESIEGIDFEVEEKLVNKKTELTTVLKELQNKIASDTRAHDRTEVELIKAKQEYEHLAHNNCPYCLQQMPNAADKIKETQKDIDSISNILEDHSDNLVQQLMKEEHLVSQLAEINSQIKYNNLPQLLEIKSNAAISQAQLAQLSIAINPHFDTFELLEAEAIEVPNYSNLDKLKSLLEHQQFLLKLLTDKNSFIRRRIISKTIPFLNLQMNSYSKILGLPHVVKFMDDMSCNVSEFGRELDFGNLSAGEKKRVNLAMSLAFRDVLSHLHAQNNLLFVDEIDASLCPLGVENAISLLKSKTKQDNLSTWVVMHRAEAQGRFDRDIIVHKRNGFTELEYKNSEV